MSGTAAMMSAMILNSMISVSLTRVSKPSVDNIQGAGELGEGRWIMELADIYENAFGRPCGDEPSERCIVGLKRSACPARSANVGLGDFPFDILHSNFRRFPGYGLGTGIAETHVPPVAP